ncbi:YqzK family protein [Oceanobacillus profundus]|nr:YqzK family protein [Oceanobacillus profundus]MBR3120719.1 YqzK family protein [Oceanobacillus sp.]MCM3396565.1 YqzK family protein [Oceanobacillus profundus]MDO6451092.1 YqzK family protein [Oceanobacillus profundus]
MNRMIRDTIKVFVIFTMCTVIFYVGLQIMHREYEEIHRYDPPEGPAVKVFHSQTKLLERFQLFFKAGE